MTEPEPIETPTAVEIATHKQLVERAARWLSLTRGCCVVTAERSPRWSREVPDAFGIRSGGRVIVVECKVSRADFLRDKAKTHTRLGTTIGDERWYFAPPHVIDPKDVPEDHGLIDVFPNAMRRRKEAPLRRVTVVQVKQALAFLYDYRACQKCALSWNPTMADVDVGQDSP